MKMVQPLSLKQKSLNQIFVINLMHCCHQAEDVAANANVAFKNFTPFTRSVTHINDEHVETAENLDIIMPMFSLLEYPHNYANSSGSLCQF